MAAKTTHAPHPRFPANACMVMVATVAMTTVMLVVAIMTTVMLLLLVVMTTIMRHLGLLLWMDDWPVRLDG